MEHPSGCHTETAELNSGALVRWVAEAPLLAVQAERGAAGDEYIGRILCTRRPESKELDPTRLRGAFRTMSGTMMNRLSAHTGSTERSQHVLTDILRMTVLRFRDSAPLFK